MKHLFSFSSIDVCLSFAYHPIIIDQSRVHFAIFPTDNRYILTVNDNGIIKIWNISGQCLYTSQKMSSITSVFFLFSDNRYILTTHYSSKINLWQNIINQSLFTYCTLYYSI